MQRRMSVDGALALLVKLCFREVEERGTHYTFSSCIVTGKFFCVPRKDRGCSIAQLCLHNLGGGPWGLWVQTDCLDYASWNHESCAFSDAQKPNCYFIFVEIKWCLCNMPKPLTIFCRCFLQGEKKGNYCRNEKNIIIIWLHKNFCFQIYSIFVIFIIFQYFP